MSFFRKGDKVFFTDKAVAELSVVSGTVHEVRRVNGKYLYDVKVSAKLLGIELKGVKVTGNVITCVNSDLLR